MTENVLELAEPIRLGFYGSRILRKGDNILYRPSDEGIYTPAVVVDPWVVLDNGQRVRASISVKAQGVPVDEPFYVAFDELFWDRNTPIPADRLESIINELSQKRGSGITITI